MAITYGNPTSALSHKSDYVSTAPLTTGGALKKNASGPSAGKLKEMGNSSTSSARSSGPSAVTRRDAAKVDKMQRNNKVSWRTTTNTWALIDEHSGDETDSFLIHMYSSIPGCWRHGSVVSYTPCSCQVWRTFRVLIEFVGGNHTSHVLIPLN